MIFKKKIICSLFSILLFLLFSCRDMIHDISGISSSIPEIESLSMKAINDVTNGGTSGLEAFEINSYETTYIFWHEVEDWGKDNGYTFIKKAQAGESGETGDGGIYSFMPVTSLHPADIIVWCNALSEKRGLTPVYYKDSSCSVILKTASDIASKSNSNVNYVDANGNPIETYDFTLGTFYRKTNADGYRLPSKAEWGYAAQGARRTKEDIAYKFSGSANLSEVASLGKIRMPGRYKSNGAGTCDMNGNVCEFTLSGSVSSSVETLSNSSIDCYGGHYNSTEQYCKINNTSSLYSFKNIIGIYPSLIGFRLVKSIK